MLGLSAGVCAVGQAGSGRAPLCRPQAWNPHPTPADFSLTPGLSLHAPWVAVLNQGCPEKMPFPSAWGFWTGPLVWAAAGKESHSLLAWAPPWRPRPVLCLPASSLGCPLPLQLQVQRRPWPGPAQDRHRLLLADVTHLLPVTGKPCTMERHNRSVTFPGDPGDLRPSGNASQSLPRAPLTAALAARKGRASRLLTVRVSGRRPRSSPEQWPRALSRPQLQY